MTRRPRGNDLHQVHVERLPGFSDSLIRSVLGRDYGKPAERKTPLPAEAFSGPKARRKGSPGASGSDALVLEVRRLREDFGMTALQIRKELLQCGIDLDGDRIQQIFSYQTRAHLVPQSGHHSYLKKEPPCTTSEPSTD